MTLPITAVTAATLALLLIFLSTRVIAVRRTDRISLGDGGQDILARRIRAHGNLTEYAPLGLILTGLAEAQGASSVLTGIGAALLVGGRLSHAVSLSLPRQDFRLRTLGMVGTFTAFAWLAVLAVAAAF